MPTIIVATDFSEVATHAVSYACQLSQDINGSVTLFHSYTIPITMGDMPFPAMTAEEATQLATTKMNELVAGLQQTYPHIAINTVISFGDVVDGLQDLITTEKPLMIVLGNNGTKDQLMWLGSNIVTAMRTLNVPVLGVTLDCDYRLPQSICYACDFKTNDNIAIATDIKHIITLFNAALTVLYIDHHAETDIDELQKEMVGSYLFETLKPFQPTYRFQGKNKINTTIEEFVASNGMDWLIVVPRKHSYLEQLFGKTHTETLVQKTTVPILALHEGA